MTVPGSSTTLDLAMISKRNALFDLLDQELNWAPVMHSLQCAVHSSDPSLLPGDESYIAPALPAEPPRYSHRPRTTWAMRVAYFGPAFRGYAWQREFPDETVDGCLDAALKPLLDGKASRLACSGRTDAGVSALAQLVSFTSFPELSEAVIRDAVESAAPTPGSLRVLSAARVPRSWHATFSTCWRRYVYLLPAAGLGVSCADVHRQIAPLVGAPHDFRALARGLPRGKDTTCTLLHAQCTHVVLPHRRVAVAAVDGVVAGEAGTATPTAGTEAVEVEAKEEEEVEEAIRIEIVGDRFLRRMVRTLVSSAVWAAQREGAAAGVATTAAAGEQSVLVRGGGDSLLSRIATSGEQAQTAHPAPARGLVFAGAGCEGDCWDAFVA